MVEELLSGLIGALIATIISAVYFHVAEQARLRAEVMLEVIGYTEDVYDRLQRLYVHKGALYTTGKRGLLPQEYRAIGRELASILKSTKTHAKLAIAYGEGDEVGMLNELTGRFREVHGLITGATRSTWANIDCKIQSLFEKEIDPLRSKLSRRLFQGTRIHSIAVPTFYRLLLRVEEKAP